MITFSVIIPTYNRCTVLGDCVRSFCAQRFPAAEYEIIVADDGSTDATRETVAAMAAGDARILYCVQENRGPAAARNLGLSRARGVYVLLSGDDIIASPDLLAQHLAVLSAGTGRGVVGLTEWDPALKDPFRDFLIEYGHQFDYRGLRSGSKVSWEKFYASNVSLERRWFGQERFDERFRFPSYEDLDLGYRLCRKGLSLFFNPDALASHRHAVSEEEFYRKAWQNGNSRAYFLRKHGKHVELGLLSLRSALTLAFLGWSRSHRRFASPRSRWSREILYHTSRGICDALSVPAKNPSLQNL